MVKKKISLEKIPTLLERIVGLIDREIDQLSDKDSLSSEETKNLITYGTLLSGLYKDYRAEVLTIQKDLKSKSKEEILQIVKSEAK